MHPSLRPSRHPRASNQDAPLARHRLRRFSSTRALPRGKRPAMQFWAKGSLMEQPGVKTRTSIWACLALRDRVREQRGGERPDDDVPPRPTGDQHTLRPACFAARSLWGETDCRRAQLTLSRRDPTTRQEALAQPRPHAPAHRPAATRGPQPPPPRQDQVGDAGVGSGGGSGALLRSHEVGDDEAEVDDRDRLGDLNPLQVL